MSYAYHRSPATCTLREVVNTALILERACAAEVTALG
jgi:hypothetical protein